MNALFKSGMIFAFLSVSALGLQAQSRGRMAAVPRPSASAAPRTAPSPIQAAPTRSLMASRDTVQVTVINNFQPTLGNPSPVVVSTDSFPVPGLGFDFVHLAAVDPNFRRFGGGTRVLSSSFFAVPFFGFGSASPVIVVPPPQVIVIQSPAPQPQPVEDDAVSSARRGRAPLPAPPEPAPAETAPKPDARREADDFVLVRRDGGLVFAVAFFFDGADLHYVTHDGVRRTLALASLDLDATRRMNEERGTQLHLPS